MTMNIVTILTTLKIIHQQTSIRPLHSKMHQQKVLGMAAGDPAWKSLQTNWRNLHVAVNVQPIVLAG